MKEWVCGIFLSFSPVHLDDAKFQKGREKFTRPSAHDFSSRLVKGIREALLQAMESKGSTTAAAKESGKSGAGPVPGAAAAAPAAGGGSGAKEATVIIIGAGPAGMGTAALLKQCGIKCIVLERGEVGQSFKAWSVPLRACLRTVIACSDHNH